jgi:hypothetical protein
VVKVGFSRPHAVRKHRQHTRSVAADKKIVRLDMIIPLLGDLTIRCVASSGSAAVWLVMTDDGDQRPDAFRPALAGGLALSELFYYVMPRVTGVSRKNVQVLENKFLSLSGNV